MKLRALLLGSACTLLISNAYTAPPVISDPLKPLFTPQPCLANAQNIKILILPTITEMPVALHISQMDMMSLIQDGL